MAVLCISEQECVCVCGGGVRVRAKALYLLCIEADCTLCMQVTMRSLANDANYEMRPFFIRPKEWLNKLRYDTTVVAIERIKVKKDVDNLFDKGAHTNTHTHTLTHLHTHTHTVTH